MDRENGNKNVAKQLVPDKRVCSRGNKVYYVCESLLLKVAKRQSMHACGVRVRRSQLEVVPRNGIGGSRPLSTMSAGGSLGRGSRALHLQHHQSSLSALHMASNHSNTVDRRRSSLRVMSNLPTPSSLFYVCISMYILA